MSSSNSSLIFEERAFTCGYGPRSILGSSSDTRNDLYIGCKDGSVTVIRGPAKGSELKNFAAPEVCSTLNSGVRALREVTPSLLLAGLADGSVLELWVADRSKGKARVVLGSERNPVDGGTNPVRTIARLEKGRFLVSRRRGAVVVNRHGQGWSEPRAINAYPEDVRVVQPLKKPRTNERVWLLVTGRGAVYPWDGVGEIPKSTAWGPCHDDEHPAILNDFALLRNHSERKAGGAARGLFLATDLGVFLLTVLDDEPLLHCQPISLPGLGAMPTALSYSEVMVGAKSLPFLWVADARGDSHLFEQSNPGEAGGPRFRRSGVRHTQRETLLCYLWTPSDSPYLLCGQARRNDQLVLGRYWDPDWEQVESADLSYEARVRRLLSHGWWKTSPAAAQEDDRDRLKEDLVECLETIDPGREGPHFESYEGWPLEALLTELIERLGEQEDTRLLLIDAIRSPQARIARKLLNGGKPHASRLWTLALLGVIHRSRGDRPLAYLGLLRWLRNRQEELLKSGNREALASKLSEDLGFARKWGLHGDANARRRNLLDPIRTLKGQQGDERKSDLALDHLTYQALLLNRRISRIDRRTYDQVRGRRAWSLCVAGDSKESSRELVAVSWMWGGVELFELLEHPQGDPPSRFKPLLRFPPPGPGSSRVPDPRPARERKVEFRMERGRVSSGQTRLQQSGLHRSLAGSRGPVPADRSLGSRERRSAGLWNSPPERILLWEIGDGKRVDSYGEVPLDPGQSVYSVLELRPGQLLLGLRGYKGDALIALLSVTIEASELRGRIRVRRSPTIGNGGPVTNRIRREESLHRNRVWSLACDPEAISDGSTIDVVIGCEGGQIYRLSLGPKVFASDEVTWKLVDRMSSPVRALLYRAPGDGFPFHRVYAGGENGTVMAWQAPQGDDPTFATLWATQEESPVAGLHRLSFDDRDRGRRKPEGKRPEGKKPKSRAKDSKTVILAITRLGRAVLLDDRPTLDVAAAPSDRPQRLPVPGSRFGRYSLPEDVWASSLFAGDLDQAAVENGAFCALLTASDDGTLTLSSLHSPSKSTIRKGRYKYVLDQFREIVGFDETPENIRLGEAVFAAVPSLSWILIRWLLDPAFPEMGYPKPEAVDESFLPRHLRPLRALRLAWDRLEAETPDKAVAKDAEKTVGAALAAALERAWHLEDLHTYQEICAMVLKRANFTLYRTCEQRGRQNWLTKKQRIADLYIAVYRAIETSLPSWLGTEKRQEARARAVVAKQMVDGDTIWKVMKEVAEEKESGEERAVRADP